MWLIIRLNCSIITIVVIVLVIPILVVQLIELNLVCVLLQIFVLFESHLLHVFVLLQFLKQIDLLFILAHDQWLLLFFASLRWF